jgi:copper chaperone NosL
MRLTAEARRGLARGLGYVCAGLAVACAAEATAPPAVRWGVDECSDCHMILGDERFAAVARSQGGEEARFDDLGCLVRFLGEEPSLETWQVWVHDAGGPGWLPAEGAWYSRDPKGGTPMGSGLRAWPSPEAAARAGGRARSWSELREGTASAGT